MEVDIFNSTVCDERSHSLYTERMFCAGIDKGDKDSCQVSSNTGYEKSHPYLRLIVFKPGSLNHELLLCQGMLCSKSIFKSATKRSFC